MIDRRMEDLLREWYRSDVGTEPAPVSLRLAISAIPATVPSATRPIDRLGGSRVRLVLVAALLAALVGTALVIGAQLMRSPEPPIPELTRFVGAECMRLEELALPADQLMVFEDRNVSPGFEGDEDAPPGSTLILFADGRLVTLANGRTRAQIASADAAVTERRLSPRGVQLLFAAIDRSGLAISGCHYDLKSDGPLRQLDVRLPDRADASTHWGSYSGFDEPVSAADLTALEELQALVARLEDWLPAEGWVDAGPPVAGQRWRIVVRLIPAASAMTLGAPGNINSPDVDVLDLPGPEGPSTFGTLAGVEQGGIVVRCQVITATTATSFTAHLRRTGAPIANFSFWFWDRGNRVMVDVRPLVDSASGCAPVDLGLAGPSPSPSS